MFGALPHPAGRRILLTVHFHPGSMTAGEIAGVFAHACQTDDAPGGGIVVRPWGERSFYAEDPWKNPLCFVEEGTVNTG